AEAQGVDMVKFKSALDGNTHKAFVDAESAVADKAEISGTPAFVINGYFINGAQPFPKFQKIINLALKEAGEKVSEKTPEKAPEKAKTPEKAADKPKAPEKAPKK